MAQLKRYEFIVETRCVEVHVVEATSVEEAEAKYDRGESYLKSDEMQDSELVRITDNIGNTFIRP